MGAADGATLFIQTKMSMKHDIRFGTIRAYYSFAINPDFDLASSLEHDEYVKNKEKELPKQMR